MKCGIIGCGYTGTELAWQLRTNGHEVIGVRRSQSGVADLSELGYQAVQADVTDAATLQGLPAVDCIVYSVSPGRGNEQTAEDVYHTGLKNTLQATVGSDDHPDRFFYISSTGVYGDRDGELIDETTRIDPQGDRQQLLVRAENTVREHTTSTETSSTIIRLGGIYGPHRHRLQSYLDGPVTARYSNLVHRDDAAGIIRFLIETNQGRDEILNGVDGCSVSKWEIANWIAKSLGKSPPEKQLIADRLQSVDSPVRRERIAANKRCSNEKLLKTGYQFKYPSFREGYADIISGYSP